jgi:peptidoglycan/xylan/chitin deacetylase (PgdA/CDA1 family)
METVKTSNNDHVPEKIINVPMVTYHSIANLDDGWLFRHLSCPVAIFESHLKTLQYAKYHTISLQKLYEYMAAGRQVPQRSVVLTFDDGYLDNWVYVYPLLKKYNLLGTIFINPDFVDPRESLRPNLEDVWKRQISIHELTINGFLSWQEMRKMEASGHIDIQSHGLTHTWYFSSPQIIDFHHPGDAYPWLAWNAHPEYKYLWMIEDQRNFVPWGIPIYQNEKSLATRRYFPDHDLDMLLVEYVKARGNEEFFQMYDWYSQLNNLAADFSQTHANQGHFETDEEYHERLYHELAESKHIIEERLKKKVDFLCWPGGGYNDISVELSKEIGYSACVHSSHDPSVNKNRYGEDPSRFSRISPPWFRWSDTRVAYKGGLYFICLLNSIRGLGLFTIFYKLLRIPFKLSQWINYH